MKDPSGPPLKKRADTPPRGSAPWIGLAIDPDIVQDRPIKSVIGPVLEPLVAADLCLNSPDILFYNRLEKLCAKPSQN